MDRMKVACAGMGRRSRAHLPVLKALEVELELVGVCDVVEKSAKEAGEIYGVPHYTIVRPLLSSNFAIIPQFLVLGRFFNQIWVEI